MGERPCKNRRIAKALSAKVQQAIDRSERLMSLVPKDSSALAARDTGWRHGSNRYWSSAGTPSRLYIGFCACFARAFLLELAEAASLRALEVNHFCEASTALLQLSQYRDFIDRASSLCSNEDLKRLIPTVFVPDGETLLTA